MEIFFSSKRTISIVLIIITQYQRVNMSFLQLISKPNNQKSINPAFFQLLNHQRIPKIASHKSQQKQTTFPQEPLGMRNGLKTREATVKKKQFNRTQRSKGISYSKSQFVSSKTKNISLQRNSREGIFQKKPGLQTNRAQYNHSFSNYLAKKHLGPNKYHLHGKLMYYDLEEIVNKIASPIKLEPKLEVDQGIIQCKAKKAVNFNQYQRFLREVHYQKNRYHKDQFDQDDQNITIKQGRYVDVIAQSKQVRPKRKSLWLKRTPKKSQKRELDIMPWHQNQEQNSPMKPKNICSFRPNPISQDFQPFIV